MTPDAYEKATRLQDILEGRVDPDPREALKLRLRLLLHEADFSGPARVDVLAPDHEQACSLRSKLCKIAEDEGYGWAPWMAYPQPGTCINGVDFVFHHRPETFPEGGIEL